MSKQRSRITGVILGGALLFGVCSCMIKGGGDEGKSVFLTPSRLQLKDGVSTPEKAVLEARGDGLFRGWYGLRVENPTDQEKRVDVSAPTGFSPEGHSVTLAPKSGEDIWFGYDLPANAREFSFILRSRDANNMEGPAEVSEFPCEMLRNVSFKLNEKRLNRRVAQLELPPLKEDGGMWASDLSGTVCITGAGQRIAFYIQIRDQEFCKGDHIEIALGDERFSLEKNGFLCDFTCANTNTAARADYRATHNERTGLTDYFLEFTYVHKTNAIPLTITAVDVDRNRPVRQSSWVGNLRYGWGLELSDWGAATGVVVDHGLKQAATLFTNLMERVNGTVMSVVSNEQKAVGRPMVVLKCTDIPRAKDLTDDIYNQSYRIVTVGNSVVIEGPHPRAVLYGVAGFFSDVLGCKFFAGPYEYIPQIKTVTVPNLKISASPSFPMRGNIWGCDVDKTVWYQKMRAGGFPYSQLVGSHSFNSDIRIAGGTKDLNEIAKKHPDWFAADEDGKRNPTSMMGVCGCSPTFPGALATALVTQVNRRLELRRKHREAVRTSDYLIGCAQGDGFTPCMCPECRALVKKEGAESAPIIQLLNRALDIANREIPEMRVVTYAYFNTLPPPKTMSVHSNLYVCIVSSSMSMNQSGDQLNEIETSPSNRSYANAIREWNKIAPGRCSIYHWDTPDYGNGLLMEWPCYFAHAKDMRFWHQSGIACPQAYSSIAAHEWGPFVSWLKYSQMWDITVDEWKLAEEFARCCYGEKAAPYVLEYWHILEEARQQAGYDASIVRWYSWPQYRIDKLLTRPVMDRLEAALNKAIAAAKEDVDVLGLRRTGDGAPACAFSESCLLARVKKLMPQHVDMAYMEHGKREPYELIQDPTTGEPWVVRGGDKRLPDRIRRIGPAYRESIDFGKPSRFFYSEIEENLLIKDAGSEAVPLSGEGFETWYAPRIWGRLFSLKKDGVEIFANSATGSGYFDNIYAEPQWWPLKEGETKSRLSTRAEIVPHRWAYGERTCRKGYQHYDRTVEFVDGAMIIKRAYEQEDCTKRLKLREDMRFSPLWSFALPSIERASVGVVGGGIKKILSLTSSASAAAGGKTFKHSNLAADCQNPLFDKIEETPSSGDILLPVEKQEGEVTIAFARGDGLVIELVAEAKGLEAVRVHVEAEWHRLDIELVSQPYNFRQEPLMGSVHLDLPSQKLTVKGKLTDPIEVQRYVRPHQPAKIRLIDADHAINLADGAELVRIPAGAFWRGSQKGTGYSDEWPQRKITLSEYWMYKEPVSYGTYTNVYARMAPGKEFARCWGQGQMLDRKVAPERYPVLMSWNEADEYARFVGGHLPTEAQWEKGARGSSDARIYPWGDDWANGSKCVSYEQTVELFKYGILPTGTYPAGNSPYGLVDMAGNNFEWVNDWYAHDYYAVSPEKDPQGPEHGVHKVLRGGDSYYAEQHHRCSARMICDPAHRDFLKTGFRVVIENPTIVK